MGAVIMSYPSFSFPWIHAFPVAGNYSLEISPLCGVSKCTPCRFFFTVTCSTACDCNISGWQPFTSTVGNNPSQTITCGTQIAIKKGMPFKLMGKHLCKGDCESKYVTTLRNTVTGEVIETYPAFSFSWVYTFQAAGTYKLELIPICGTKRCMPCTIYFTVM